MMLQAARAMQKATELIGAECKKRGVLDVEIDPNRTGFIGPEDAGLTTTLGHLDAKRTTTNPDMAGLIVRLLLDVGVTEGDTIAIGSSASFPALMVASVLAAKALKVHPVIIISLGSSSFGATHPDFHLLDMYQLLLAHGLFSVPPAAVSLGGGGDVGKGFDPDIRRHLIHDIEASGIPCLTESGLEHIVKERLEVYLGNPPSRRIAAFINAGGSFANLGTSSLVLKVRPGLNQPATISLPPNHKMGMIFAMARENIPVIHLLYIKGLVSEHGLPWDPVPLPVPGSAEAYRIKSHPSTFYWIVLGCYVVIIGLLLGFTIRKTRYNLQYHDEKP